MSLISSNSFENKKRESYVCFIYKRSRAKSRTLGTIAGISTFVLDKIGTQRGKSRDNN